MSKLRDVGELAGVSEATVSYVLNEKHEKEHISPATCAKVWAAAKSLGYKFDDIARGMATGRTNVIGFLPFTLQREYVASTLAGIMRRAQELNYFVKTLDYSRDMKPEEIAGICRRQRLAGMICYGIPPGIIAGLQGLLAPVGVPLIVVSSGVFPEDWACVSITANDEQGGFLATEHLLRLGHRRIAFIGGIGNQPSGLGRRAGYLMAMQSFGLDVPPNHVRFLSDDGLYVQAIASYVDAALAGAGPPSAFFCSSDSNALAAITHMLRKGVRVPEDISVVGYSDMSFSWFMSPAITTVREPYQDIGAKAVEVMESMIKVEAVASRKMLVDVELVPRESSGPPKPSI